jgi:hypothetical protein
MMQTEKHSSHAILSQTENNSTLWIGHLQTDPADHCAGQIFKCPAEGLVNNIQVYSSAVHHPGEINLTLHEFDTITKTWGPAIGNASRFLQMGDTARWIRFGLQPVLLRKEVTYGFRLQTNDALIGIGEAATANKKPFNFGYEWNGDSANAKGHYFTYFSLAFKVEMCA